jgi:hypothetical protein
MVERRSPYSGLEKQSKTIPLHGGIQQDADDFLFDSPNMAYVENGVFDRQGVISKQPTLVAGAVPPAALVNGDGVVGGKGIFLTQTGTAIWDKATNTWKSNTEQDNYTVEKVSAGSQTYNGIHICGGVFDDGSSLVVTEDFTPGVNRTEGSHSITVQIYDPEGAIAFTEKFTGQCPKVTKLNQDSPTLTMALFWVDGSDALKVRGLDKDGWNFAETVVLDGTTPATSVVTDGWNFTNPTAFSAWYDSGSTSYYRGHCRLSMAENASETGQYCVTHGYNLAAFVFAATKCQDGEIYFSKIVLGGSVTTIASGFVDTITSTVSIADFQVNPEDSTFSPWALIATRFPNTNANAGNYNLNIQKVNGTAWTLGTNTLVVSGGSGCFVKGVIVPNEASSDAYSLHTTVASTNELYQFGIKTPPPSPATTFMFLYDGTTLKRFLLNQIPVSKMTIDNTADNLYVVLNDWAPWHPEGSSSISAGVQRQGEAPAATKGRVDSLVKFDLTATPTTTIEVIATYLAGTAKASPASMVELEPWHNCLWYNESLATFEYVGRQLIVPEDLYVFVEDNLWRPEALTGDNKMVRSLGFGISRGIVLRSTRVSSANKVPRAAHGRSVYFGCAKPIVASGNGISPLSYPGVPEITFVVSSHDPAYPYSSTYSSIVGSVDLTQMYLIGGYVDGNGMVYRSSPSSLVYCDGIDFDDLPSAASGGDDPINVNVCYPILDEGRSFFIELYVGQKLTEPLLLSTNTSTAGAAVTAKYTPFIDTSAGVEKNISGTRAGYVSGGQLGVDPWPCFRDITFTSNRMFTIPVEFDGVVQYSKLFEENVAPEYNGALNISFGHDRRIECIETLDDKVVVFERDRIHYINGSGPDNFGGGGDFVVQLISSDVGCSDPNSVIETPEGLMFYSPQSKEFHLLSRNLEIVDVGKPVAELTKSITGIVDATLCPQNHEVRFIVVDSGGQDLLAAGDTGVGVKDQPPRPRVGRSWPANPILTFNYRFKQWSILKAQALPTSSLLVDDTYVNTNVLGLGLSYEDPDEDKYQATELMKLETPWIRVGDLQNYGKVYTVNLLGRYLSSWKDDGLGNWIAGDMQVTMKYDYEESGTQTTFRWRAQQDLNDRGRDNLQVKMRPGRRKCQSIKLIIEEIPTEKIEISEPDYTNGRGFEVSGLEIVYGLQNPDYPVVPTRRSK